MTCTCPLNVKHTCQVLNDGNYEVLEVFSSEVIVTLSTVDIPANYTRSTQLRCVSNDDLDNNNKMKLSAFNFSLFSCIVWTRGVQTVLRNTIQFEYAIPRRQRRTRL